MNKGFDDGKAKVYLDEDEVQKLLKSYKKIKKYMKSSIHEVRKMNGEKDIVSELIEEYSEDPMD